MSSLPRAETRVPVVESGPAPVASSPRRRRRSPWWRRLLRGALRLAAVGVVAAVLLYAAFQLSPWPGALVIRWIFDRGGVAAAEALEKHLPPAGEVAERLDLRYGEADSAERLDVFYPASVEGTPKGLPTLVWVHGGAWVSGAKGQIANYARIVAARGYTVVNVGYTLAPRAQHPTPARQVHAALGYLTRHAGRLHVDTTRIFLAGDSAGAHVAAQVAATIQSPDYARSLGVTPGMGREPLRGVVLFCGAYDVEAVNLEGGFGGFLRTVLWAYSGRKDFPDDLAFVEGASVIRHLDANFPPVFLSAGNADPLLAQSLAFDAELTRLGVPVDRLFFAKDHAPALGHEYQFDLDGAAGREALTRLLAFLETKAR